MSATEDIERKLEHGADRYFGKDLDALSSVEKTVLKKAISRRTLARNTETIYSEKTGFGDRMSDGIASFGGSWAFILSFLAFLAIWVAANIALAMGAFDPYPFIFLNLMLSMIARLAAAHDYEINLKAEVEIMALHDKLDQMREHELRALVEKQQEQLDLLTRVVLGKRSE